VEEDVVVCPLRRVSSAVERGILLQAGTILGMGEDGRDVSESTDLVVLDLIRRRDGWLLRYMTLPDRQLIAALR
jgi:hypothetical protein